jgi:hypothetical protein
MEVAHMAKRLSNCGALSRATLSFGDKTVISQSL